MIPGTVVIPFPQKRRNGGRPVRSAPAYHQFLITPNAISYGIQKMRHYPLSSLRFPAHPPARRPLPFSGEALTSALGQGHHKVGTVLPRFVKKVATMPGDDVPAEI
jgi:hypothetical protein